MSILEFGSDHDVPRLDFELMAGCDHGCSHCYNVWNADEDDPQGGYLPGQLRTDEFKAMMRKAVEQSGAEHLTITGGEPLLRKGALEIVDFACELVPSVQLITNGSHLPPETCRRLSEAGLDSVQLTLLSADPVKHDQLKGAECFDETVRAAVDLGEAGVPLQVCFVAMRQNWEDFEEVMELSYTLEAAQISYNRMSPTGGAIHHIARLLPDLEHVEANLETADRLGRRFDLPVATAMPIPPCLTRLERFEWVQFGFCSTGTASPNLTIDPKGNVRSCNLADGLLGNIVEQDWAEIHAEVERYQRQFQDDVPELCQGCRYESSCQGGCKESAFATFGDRTHPEPFVFNALNPDWRERLHEHQRDKYDCPGATLGAAE